MVVVAEVIELQFPIVVGSFSANHVEKRKEKGKEKEGRNGNHK